MKVMVTRPGLVGRFGKKHPSALKTIARDLTATTLDDGLRAQRDTLFVRFLKARGDRNVTVARAPKRFIESLERPEGVSDLMSDAQRPVLRGLCAIWLTLQSDAVTEVESVFEVSDEQELEAPTFDEIEAALGRFGTGRGAAVRTALFALLCTQRLGAVSEVLVGVVPGGPDRGAERHGAAANSDDGGDRGRGQPVVSPGVTSVVEAPPKSGTAIKSTTLGALLKTLRALSPDDPAWDEIDDWVAEVRGCAEAARAERTRLRDEASLRARLARWSGEYASLSEALMHRIPTWAQLRDVSSTRLSACIDAVFEAYDLLVALKARPREGFDAFFSLPDEIAAKKLRAGVAVDAVWRLIPAVSDSSVAKSGATSQSSIPSLVEAEKPLSPSSQPPSPQSAKPPPPQPLAHAAPASTIAPSKPPAPPVLIQPPGKAATPQVSAAILRGYGRPASDRARDVMLCLDFGTARSKAMAVRSNGKPEFLAIGAVTRSTLNQSIGSSVWIDMAESRMHFGDTAIQKSVSQGQVRHRRIDSLKDFLSASTTIDSALPNPDGQPLPEGFDPSGMRFTIGEVLVLYLGYLCWAAEESLRTVKITSDVPRRFAIPSWDHTRRKAGVDLLRTYLARATLLARHVGARWLDGLPLEEARSLARAALELPIADLPLDLYVEGITEPFAAVGTRNEELVHRNGLVLVADIGAGTSDFGLFLVSAPNSEPRFIEVASHSINRAGNHIDEILRRFVVRDLFGGKQGMASAAADMELQLRQRSIKEDLFTRKQTRVKLQAGLQMTLDLETFRREPEVKTFESDLRKAFCETFAVAERTHASSGHSIDWSRYLNVRVVLTGGGAVLPMARDLAGLSFQPFRNPGFENARVTITSQATASLPQPVRAFGVTEEAYLPLAVAWGGAMPVLPEQGNPVGPATVRAPGSQPSVADALVPAAERAWR